MWILAAISIFKEKSEVKSDTINYNHGNQYHCTIFAIDVCVGDIWQYVGTGKKTRRGRKARWGIITVTIRIGT